MASNITEPMDKLTDTKAAQALRDEMTADAREGTERAFAKLQAKADLLAEAAVVLQGPLCTLRSRSDTASVTAADKLDALLLKIRSVG